MNRTTIAVSLKYKSIGHSILIIPSVMKRSVQFLSFGNKSINASFFGSRTLAVCECKDTNFIWIGEIYFSREVGKGAL